MNGQPIDEPVVGHGPFVMNTSQEIRQAFVDLHYGKMGKVPDKEVRTWKPDEPERCSRSSRVRGTPLARLLVSLSGRRDSHG